MLTKAGLEFVLKLTDFFHGHWEDPGWGQRPMNQVLVALSSHTLANGIEDPEARRQVQATLEKSMVDAAQKIVRHAS